MNSITHIVALLAGLVLLMHVTPSWGQPTCASPGCNPTVSDTNNNTAGGTGALLNVTSGAFGGFQNTAFGSQALKADTTGDGNTGIGYRTLQANTTGAGNTATGLSALESNTTGSTNTAVGDNALAHNTTGQSNTATGGGALTFNTTGASNVANGAFALHTNGAGNNNTATGVESLENNTTGSLNTASGLEALQANLTGNNNTAIGAKALKKALGTKNIAIGFQAGVSLVNGNNNIFIGNQGVGDEAQTIRIGTAQAQTFIAGINNASVSGAQVMVDTTTGQLGIVTSSARYKRNIETMASRSEGLLKLRPVTFTYQADTAAAPHYGLVAEEVATVYPELVTRTAAGEVQTVKYHELIPMLVNELQRGNQALQREHQAVEQQRAELAELRKELAELRALAGSRLER